MPKNLRVDLQLMLEAELKKTAQNTQFITTYFVSTLMYSNIVLALTSTCESSIVSIEMELMEVELMKTEPIEAEPIEAKLMDVELMDMELAESELTEVKSSEVDKKTKMRLVIKKLDGILKKDNNQMDKGECKKWRKDIYIDGYKREDVVQYRQTVFLLMIKKLKPVLIEYDDKDLTKLIEKKIPSEKKQYCEHKIYPKGRGQCIHVSKFLYEPLGRVYLTEEQHAFYPEIPKHYITELLEIEIALLDTMLVFGFDNSSSHGAFTKDALVANRMNVGYRDKQPKMHFSRFFDSMLQEMVFPLNHRNKKKRRQPKEITE
ncbi:41960_t:CDS:2, partial [Gigaspora margarita]